MRQANGGGGLRWRRVAGLGLAGVICAGAGSASIARGIAQEQPDGAALDRIERDVAAFRGLPLPAGGSLASVALAADGGEVRLALSGREVYYVLGPDGSTAERALAAIRGR